MTPTAILQAIISILTGGIVQFGEGLGQGLSSLVTSLFFTGTGEGQALSIFAIIMLVFAGISLAMGLVRWVIHWLTSFGARNN